MATRKRSTARAVADELGLTTPKAITKRPRRRRKAGQRRVPARSIRARGD